MAIEILSPSAQVAAYLRGELLAGAWRRQLPGTPALAAELEVDRKTVTAALELLEHEGLLQPQGPGRPRKVVLPKKMLHNRLNVRILLYEEQDGLAPYVLELIRRVELRGHRIKSARKSLMQLGMDVYRVARYVEKNPADAWIIHAGSKEVLTWFAGQDCPCYAIFGRRRSLPIASVGPDKQAAMQAAVGRLIEFGHRRIVMLSREERRLPSPGHLESAFLECLASHGIKTSAYHLPNWQDNTDSFHECLDQLFRHTPPTAILLDEPHFFIATQQHLANKGLVAPRNISLLCADTHPVFAWCQPEISHICWEEEPVIRHATRWVVQLGKGKNNGSRPTFTPATFVEGGTIGPVDRPDEK